MLQIKRLIIFCLCKLHLCLGQDDVQQRNFITDKLCLLGLGKCDNVKQNNQAVLSSVYETERNFQPYPLNDYLYQTAFEESSYINQVRDVRQDEAKKEVGDCVCVPHNKCPDSQVFK